MHACLNKAAAACLLLLAGLAMAADSPRSYEVVKGWPSLPADHQLGLCAGVGVDASNRVFVFHRSGRQWTKTFPTEPIAAATVSVFDGASGALLMSWGEGRFIMPHGLSVDAEGHLWLTDVGLHQVFKFTATGELLLTLGERAVPGADATHFHMPTDVAIHPDGSLYISDGYRNARVVKYSAQGRYEMAWGSKGTSAGAFHLPHGITLDPQQRVIVCDRENERLQVFDARGVFIHEWKGPHIGKPYGIEAAPNGNLLVIDGGQPSLKPEQRGKAVVLSPQGEVLATFGSAGKGPGQFQLGHDIAIGPDGAIYVAEGTGARVQKFIAR